MIVKPIVVAIYIEIGVLVFITINFNDYSTLAVWICVVLMSVPNLCR
jgi:putative effector of murein hydrolase